MHRTVLTTLALLLASGAGARAAFWLRPPATPEELTRTLVAARQAGFTDVLLEGFYHGRTVWPSEVTAMKTTYDALKVTTDVAAREGLRVNVWFETLYWRPQDRFGIPVSPLWRDDWATRDDEGRTSLQRGGLGMVDPAEPGVGDVLERLVREVTRAYPDVGLHLDYLRYPREGQYGYHPTLVRTYEERTGQSIGALRQFGDDGLPTTNWQVWRDLRRDAVTNLADRLIGAYRASGGRGMVSAAVFYLNDDLQDWRRWKGLDVAMPMAYVPANVPWAFDLLMLNFRGDARVWPGVQVGPGFAPLGEQVRRANALGFRDVAVFDWRPGLPGLSGQPREDEGARP
ncbi:family 10 glycosylhydrolase [Deinococcus pimensis]|uniref:family 10 glycosylhydrolase n=1 Tax=Deinococcus pimensis TaxID=309888 RepID=UPI0004B7C1F1|nr:family 10 glycosylhydrolase [Deinococcus pimensis]